MRGTALLGSVKSGLLVEVVRRGSPPAELAASTRAVVRGVIGRSVGRHGLRSAAIVTAVLIGDRAGLDDETTRRLQEGGTYHVIAISGGNIVILAGCLLLFGRSTGVHPRRLSGAVILLLVAYAYLVGHEASVARATAAAVIVLGAGLLDHRTPPVNVLAVAAIGIVLVSPLAVFDPGFLLTFGATLGIVLGVSRVAATLGRLPARWVDPPPRWVALPVTLLAATLCAEGALMPIGAALFARVTLAGLVLNFFAIPLMTVTQLAGLAALALAPIHPSLSSVAGYLAHLAATGIVESTRLLDVCPWLVFRVPAPGGGGARCLLRRADAALVDRRLGTGARGCDDPAGGGRHLDRVGPVTPGAEGAPTRRLDAGQLSRCGTGGRHARAGAGRTVAARRCRWFLQRAVRHRVSGGGPRTVGPGGAAARCRGAHPRRPGPHRRHGCGAGRLRAA